MDKQEQDQAPVTELSPAEMMEVTGGDILPHQTDPTGELGDLYQWFSQKVGLPYTQTPSDPLTY